MKDIVSPSLTGYVRRKEKCIFVGGPGPACRRGPNERFERRKGNGRFGTGGSAGLERRTTSLGIVICHLAMLLCWRPVVMRHLGGGHAPTGHPVRAPADIACAVTIAALRMRMACICKQRVRKVGDGQPLHQEERNQQARDDFIQRRATHR